MKAVQIGEYGNQVVLKTGEVEVPTPNLDQVLVKVNAVSVNPFDVKLVEGGLKDKIPLEFPITVGSDFSGMIEATGDEIYGTATILGSGSGSFAEKLVVNNNKYALKPKNLTFEEAASMPLAGVSAMQALTEHINLQSGQKILIHGGAGGIGHLAIQLAKSLGAFVATTVSTEDLDFVKGLGADLVIDYKLQKFEESVLGYDAVFDTVGGKTLDKSIGVVKSGGIIVSVSGQKEGVVTQSTQINRIRLEKLSEFVEKGMLKPVIKVFQFDDVQTAWAAQSLHPQGKIVVKV